VIRTPLSIYLVQTKRSGTCALSSVLRPESQVIIVISAFSLHGGADPPFDATSSLVTCFYPNTEWVMDQPFICICGASVSYHAMRIRHRFHPPPSLVCGALKVRQSFPKKNYLLAAPSVPGSLMRYDSGTSPNAMCVIKAMGMHKGLACLRSQSQNHVGRLDVKILYFSSVWPYIFIHFDTFQ
jgi:hypothetical protein